MSDKYVWADVLAFARMARRERDLEVLPSIVANLVEAIYEVDKDKEAALESAFQDGPRCSKLVSVSDPGEEDLGAW